jgi:hypothetical protein
MQNGKKRHGGTGTRIFNIWRGMKQRCNDPGHKDYRWYGARGVRVCDEWQHDFSAFRDWALSHGYEEDLTLDRIDRTSHYAPDLCRFTDRRGQANNRSQNVYIVAWGERKTYAEWGRDPRATVAAEGIAVRIQRGMPPEVAISWPPLKRWKSQ